jgi:hypothetical protein
MLKIMCAHALYISQRNQGIIYLTASWLFNLFLTNHKKKYQWICQEKRCFLSEERDRYDAGSQYGFVRRSKETTV